MLLLILFIIVLFVISITLNLRENFGNDNNSNPKIYYINLDRAKDRNKRFTKKIKENSHFQVMRISGVTPDDLPKLNIISPESCKFNTPLEISCSISHLKAMFTAYHDSNDNNPILIMEDDMFFLKNPNWKKLISSAPKDWDILQLYTIDTTVYERKNIDWIPFQNHMFSAGAYLVNKSALRKMLESYIPEYRNPDWNSIKTIDFTNSKSVCTADFFIYQNMKTYVHTKILLNTEGLDSFIHPEHLPGHRRAINRINELLALN